MKWAIWVFVALGAIGVALSSVALFIAGIGWDATFVTQASSFARAVDPSMSLQAAYESVPNTNEFYGILADQLADLLHTAFTGSTLPLTPYDPNTYVWLGAVNIAMSAVAAASMGMAVSFALRSKLAGAFTWAALQTYPWWLGMSHVNNRDIPVAAGLTMLSSGLVISWADREGSGRLGSKRGVILGTLVASIGAAMALATRAGSFVLLVAVVIGFSLVLIVAQYWLRDPKRLIAPAITSAVAVPFAMAFCWVTDPIARISLLHWLYDSLLYSRGQFTWVVLMRTNGVDVPSNEIPWWYIPIWLLAQMPVLLILLAVLGLIVVLMATFRKRRSSTPAALNRQELLAITPFAVQGFGIPVAMIFAHVQLYDGVRHLLFVAPPVIVLCAFPIVWFERRNTPLFRGRIRVSGRVTAISIGMLVVLASLWGVARWYPYAYAFINPIAGQNHAERNWDLDYWGVSAREGIEQLKNLGIAPIVVVPHGEPGRPYGGQTFGPPDSSIVNADPGFSPVAGEPFGYYWFERFDFPFPDYECTEKFSISRDGHTIGRGGVCIP